MDAETTPAFLDFKLVFKSTDEPVGYEDASRQYRFQGFEADAQLEATVRVPSIDFTFKTDPLEASKCDFAVMGNEVNGKYYEAVSSAIESHQPQQQMGIQITAKATALARSPSICLSSSRDDAIEFKQSNIQFSKETT